MNYIDQVKIIIRIANAQYMRLNQNTCRKKRNKKKKIRIKKLKKGGTFKIYSVLFKKIFLYLHNNGNTHNFFYSFFLLKFLFFSFNSLLNLLASYHLVFF